MQEQVVIETLRSLLKLPLCDVSENFQDLTEKMGGNNVSHQVSECGCVDET